MNTSTQKRLNSKTRLPISKKTMLNDTSKLTASKFSNESIDPCTKTENLMDQKIFENIFVQKFTETVGDGVNKCGRKVKHDGSNGMKKIPLLAGVISDTSMENLNKNASETIEINVNQNYNGSKAVTDSISDEQKLSSIEARLSDMEDRLEMLVELLHTHKIINNSELKIKVEEHKIEKLNSCIILHNTTDKCLSSVDSETESIALKDSDPTITEEKILENRQKYMNLTLEKKSEETLKLNKNFLQQHIMLRPPMFYRGFQNAVRPFGNLQVVATDNNT